jgi:hypothetical protein
MKHRYASYQTGQYVPPTPTDMGVAWLCLALAVVLIIITIGYTVLPAEHSSKLPQNWMTHPYTDACAAYHGE